MIFLLGIIAVAIYIWQKHKNENRAIDRHNRLVDKENQLMEMIRKSEEKKDNDNS